MAIILGFSGLMQAGWGDYPHGNLKLLHFQEPIHLAKGDKAPSRWLACGSTESSGGD